METMHATEYRWALSRVQWWLWFALMELACSVSLSLSLSLSLLSLSLLYLSLSLLYLSLSLSVYSLWCMSICLLLMQTVWTVTCFSSDAHALSTMFWTLGDIWYIKIQMCVCIVCTRQNRGWSDIAKLKLNRYMNRGSPSPAACSLSNIETFLYSCYTNEIVKDVMYRKHW